MIDITLATGGMIVCLIVGLRILEGNRFQDSATWLILGIWIGAGFLVVTGNTDNGLVLFALAMLAYIGLVIFPTRRKEVSK